MFERICIILLINILFFAKTINYRYCSDDLMAYKRPVEKDKWKRRLLRLMGSLTTWPQMDHFMTTCFHALTCVFIYLAFGASDISFLTSLLFAVNPINNQGSVWISGRGYVAPAMLLLAAIAFPFLGPIFMFLAAYYNIGFTSLIIVCLSSAWWLGLFIVPIWMYHYKKVKHNVEGKVKQEMFGEDKMVKPQKLILLVKTFGFYFIHALIPVKQTFYHSFLQSMAGNDIMKKRAYSYCRFFWIGLVALLGISAYLMFHPWDMTNFALAWWCVGIAPFLNLFRIHQEIAERYTYLPNAGLMYFLASLLINYPIAIAIFLTAYAVKLWVYMECYRDEYFLSEMACFNSPDSWFAWHIRACKRWETQSFNEAMILWVMANMISPKEFKVLVNLATVLNAIGNEKEAEEYLKKAEANIPLGQEVPAGELIKNHRSGKLCILT